MRAALHPIYGPMALVSPFYPLSPTIIIFLFLGSSSSHIYLSPHSLCKSCLIPSPVEIYWLPASTPPCLHPGQPIFNWPISSNCSNVTNIRSEKISVDNDGTVYTKERLCFYFAYNLIKFEYICNGLEGSNRFKLGHSVFSKQRRLKRWLRRRNPSSSAIHFQQERYVKELAEDAQPNSIVVSVKAIHASDIPIYYSMIAPQDSRSQNIFTLDTISGDILLAKSLDREVLDKHVLKVTAYERIDPTISASATIIIDVLDVQDNSPVFERDSYFADIREDAPIGTTVLSVFARDLDAGLNGDVEYSLGKGQGMEYLSIHTKSGVIQTAAPLDRETTALIRLDVIASDKGDFPRQSSALIEIGIIDVNDNAPIFEKNFYNITVLENSTLPISVMRVKATDKDSGINGQVHYSIVAASSVPLTIDYSTGEVTLRDRLDTRHSPFSVLLRAKDGAQPALSSTATLTIHVIDINDHAPTFIASKKQILLDENVLVGEEVGRVYAIDEDSGDNGRVKYSLEGSSDFVIDSDSGIIRTTNLLDRENISQYDIKVIASDMSLEPQQSSTFITIILKDVNDNAPLFEKAEYNLTLAEDTPRGSQIIVLKAEDKDSDQKILYRIEHSDKDIVALIDLGEQGALLSLSGPLSNVEHHIKVEVSATDQGGQQGRCVVNIHVEDVNSAPFFTEQPYSIKIPEDSPVGFHVITIKAEDMDRGVNAYLIYSIDSKDFAIDKESGLITVIAPLNREEKSSYTITISAKDGGIPPLSSSTQIEIIIDDVNDNAPQFSSQNYTASIPEDIAVGTSFLQVSATDLDIGNNGVVDYFLNESDPTVRKDLFRLDRTSGTLRVNSHLDREQTAIINLSVFARDRGKPFLTSSSVITITLSDVNDNPPKFDQSSYDLYIAENSPVGSTVGTIIATDPDDGENALIQFRIFGGADAKLFDLEADNTQHGVVRILTRAEFDYEAKANHFFLEIQGSSGQLSSTVPVHIHVLDVNDNRPLLKDFVVLINQFEDQPFHKEIGMIPAFDPDQNATLEFYLEENDLIIADKYTGKITLSSQWKRNIEAIFKTCVSDGPNTVCAQCRLVHVYVEFSWLRESISVSLPHVGLDDFWDPSVYKRFKQSLSVLDKWKPENIHVLGTRKTNEGIDVNFVVIDKGRLVRAWKVEGLLKSGLKQLERLSLMKIMVVHDNLCMKEPCPYYQKCRQTLKYVSDMEFHQTDNFIAKTLKTLNTFICECPDGFTSSLRLPGQCDVRLDQCYSNPCKNNATCYPLENGYRCECKRHWRGTHCEIPQNSLTCIPGYCMSDSVCELEEGLMLCRHCKYAAEDSDNRCRLLSLSFDGSGLISITKDLSRLEWTLEFRLATISRDGVLLFSGDRKSDFVEVFLYDRVIRVEFSLGGKSKTVKLRGERPNRVNDGEWHTVRLEYYDKSISVLIDDCDSFVAVHAHGAIPCAAKAKMDLPPKCLDPTVPCYRFLDISNGIFLGGRPGQAGKIENGYRGCIANLSLNGELVDFSTIKEMDIFGSVEEGCASRKDYCKQSSCAPNAKCMNRWNGYNCKCPYSVHNKRECSSESSPHSRAISLIEDESYAIYQVEKIFVPFSLTLEFRTSRTDTQIIVAEFDQRSIFYKLGVEDGLLRFSIGQNVLVINAPEFVPGHWTKIEVDFGEEEVETIVDDLYRESIKISLVDISLDVVYAGLAPSTGHPSHFEGCLRDVSINGETKTVKEKGKVRQGCIVANRCNIEGVCPNQSTCHREWNRHSCKCHKGFVSDTCLPVCSLPAICGSDGFCQPTNTTKGYECQCQNGLGGVNCDRTLAIQTCPSGWWGLFPHCRKCNCAEDKGFQVQCDQQTGKCLCQKFFFVSHGRCKPCECGYGSSNLECSTDGQCECVGDASGKRCDRCSEENKILDAKTLKCRSVQDRCPSQIEYGVQWPTTFKGGIARQSCPGVETGLAIRTCGSDARWREVNSWNCTRPEYSIMVSKFDALNSFELMSMLYNATQSSELILGRNFEIAESAIHRLIDGELSVHNTDRSHLKDDWFTESLVLSTGRILSSQTPSKYLSLARKLAEYGRAVYSEHERLSFLPPFQVSSNDLIFSVDRLDFSGVLPKFNNFIDRRPLNFPSVTIHITGGKQVFYSILTNPRCIRCESPIVIVLADTDFPIRVEFELSENSGWRYPECVKLHGAVHPTWSSRQSNLIGLNFTHAVCEYNEEGIFTIFIKAENGIYLRLSNSDTVASPVMAGISLLLCALSFVCTIFRKGIRTQLIRLGFIVFFTLNAANIYLMDKISINEIFCPVRNAVFSFTTSAPFAWLFLYSLHLYRMLADGNPKSSATVCLLLGLVLPCLLSCATFLFTTHCTTSPAGWLFWFLLTPIVMFLLLSFYASATSFLISMNKQYDVLVVKFNLRKALFQHLVLTSLTLFCTGIGLFFPLSISAPLQELVYNITLVVVSLYVLVWSICPGGMSAATATATMWLEIPQKSTVADPTDMPNYGSPLLGGGAQHEWPLEASHPFLITHELCEDKVGRERELLGTDITNICRTDTLARDIFSLVVQHTNINEHVFFGLSVMRGGEHFFLEEHQRLEKFAPPGWKNYQKHSIRSQYVLYLRFRFYPQILDFIKTSITMHELYLQMRRDVIEDRLQPKRHTALELAALALQAEFGNRPPIAVTDYFDNQHYLTKRFCSKEDPNRLQSMLADLHGENSGTRSIEAEQKFIQICQRHGDFGAHIHRVFRNKSSAMHGALSFDPENSATLWIAIMPRGIAIYEEQMTSVRELVAEHLWQDTQTLQFDKKKLIIVSNKGGEPMESVFYTDHYSKSSYFVKFAASQHRFMMRMRHWKSTLKHETTIQRMPDVCVEGREPPPTIGVVVSHEEESPLSSVASLFTKMPDTLPIATSRPLGHDSSCRDRVVPEKLSNDETISNSLSERFEAATRSESEISNKLMIIRFEVTLIKDPSSGLGLTLVDGNLNEVKGVYVKSVADNGAGMRAGLCVGDRLLAVDGNSLEGSDRHKAVELVQQSGRSVRMEIARLDGVVHHERSVSRGSDVVKKSSSPLTALALTLPASQKGVSRTPPAPRRAANRRQRAVSDFGAIGDTLPTLDSENVINIKAISGLHLDESDEERGEYRLPTTSMYSFDDYDDERTSSPSNKNSDDLPSTKSLRNNTPVADSRRKYRNARKSTLDWAEGLEELGEEQEQDGYISVTLKRNSVGSLGVQIASAGGRVCVKQLTSEPAISNPDIHVGDELLCVNGDLVSNKTHQEVVAMLRSGGSVVTLGLKKSQEEKSPNLVTAILEKRPSGSLGLSLAKRTGSDGIFIRMISTDSAAASEGSLRVGDRLISLDSHSVDGLSPNAILERLKAVKGPVTISVSRDSQ